MPAIIGSLQINNVGGGVVSYGDTLNIAPKTSSKSNNGSGSSNTGGFIMTNNGFNATSTLDKDLVDQPMTDNN